MRISALALDPIEKKPLARFHPGSRVLSVGGIGCTMHCPWCQNHTIAQPQADQEPPSQDVAPRELAARAKSLEGQGNIGLAYTYNEPFTHWRDVLECSRVIHDEGMMNVVVTNGLIAPNKLERLLPYIDAFNIDLKGFDQSVYDITGGKLETVKQTIEMAYDASHVEITTLLIPGVNDNMDMIDAEASWLSSIGKDIPLHLTRFFPCYLYADHKPTPIQTLEQAQEQARQHLSDVLLGNV